MRKTAKILTAAMRHAVYRDLMIMLPLASVDEAHQFASNLGLIERRETDSAEQIENRVMAVLTRFMRLRVTPSKSDLPEIERYLTSGSPLARYEPKLFQGYGELLLDVPGFRRDETGAIRLELPKRSALWTYRDEKDEFFAGILCQPLDQPKRVFLLSSSRYGGPRATPLAERDQHSIFSTA
jgi:hypothetical protein